jgi:hypothetical protein
MRSLAEEIRLLPPGLWDYLLGCEGGFAIISPHSSGYTVGPARVGRSQVQNAAYLSVEDLAQGNERALHVLGHLVDHYLGCAGQEHGPWLSEGGGVVPRWQEAGQRLPRLFALGYAPDDVAGSNVRDYFAQCLALYCRERQDLNVADPQIYKWFRSTLWQEAFWQAAPAPRTSRDQETPKGANE